MSSNNDTSARTETHDWHAKWFRMVQAWGCNIADIPNEKLSSNCTVQDLSFYVCIELEGPQNQLVDGLSSLTSKLCGLTFAAASYLNGSHEGSCLLFQSGLYPRGAIGEVAFMWRPLESKDENERRLLWIWAHPSFWEDIWEQLVSSFEEKAEPPQKRRKDMEYSNGVVRLCALKGLLNRFRVLGSESLTTLQHCLKPARILGEHVRRKAGAVTLERCQSLSKWWTTFYTTEDRKTAFEVQNRTWKAMAGVQSPSQLPPKSVLGVVVRDPRLVVQQDAQPDTEADTSDTSGSSIATLPSMVSFSPLWDKIVRQDVTDTMTSDQHLNDLKAQFAPGGGLLDLGDDESAVPIILVQIPGVQDRNGEKTGFGCGWDVILPRGWANAFLKSLMKRGAKVIGMQESASIAFEQGRLLPPWNCPDSEACRKDEAIKRKENTDEYFRLPPSHRPNYVKYGSVAPFHSPWSELIQDWAAASGEMKGVQLVPVVLRNKMRLKLLSEALSPQQKMKGSLLQKIPAEEMNCLVAVKINLVKKGHIKPQAMICLPQNIDIQRKGWTEPQHKDIHKAEREEIRHEHIRIKKQERRKKRKNQEQINRQKDKVAADALPDLGMQHDEKLRSLWLADVTTVREACSRETFGFACQGKFSATEGQGRGLGFIALPGLLKLISTRPWNRDLKVLVRNPDSHQYHLANLAITQ